MAGNSVSCKAWCITVVSAVLVLVSDKGNPNYALIAFIPTLLFVALDAYYLSLERGFIHSYNAFVEKVHTGKINSWDVFAVSPPRANIPSALRSFSVWPFYGTLGGLILLVRGVVLS